MQEQSWLRQIHRWMSMAFTLAVAAIFLAMSVSEPAEWIYYLPLPPLGVLMLTGLYLFALPYIVRWRGGRSTEREM